MPDLAAAFGLWPNWSSHRLDATVKLVYRRHMKSDIRVAMRIGQFRETFEFFVQRTDLLDLPLPTDAGAPIAHEGLRTLAQGTIAGGEFAWCLRR